jgi:hypothetical protein
LKGRFVKNTADWVPKEASEFLEPLLVEEVENARKRLAIELWRMRGNLDHFRRCVRELLEYESMRQTWDTVSRRDDIASPVEFCEAFYQLYWCHYRFDSANGEEAGPALESLERLYDQTETLLADVNEYLAPEHDREPFWELEPPPDEYLSDLLPLT